MTATTRRDLAGNTYRTFIPTEDTPTVTRNAGETRISLLDETDNEGITLELTDKQARMLALSLKHAGIRA